MWQPSAPDLNGICGPPGIIGGEVRNRREQAASVQRDRKTAEKKEEKRSAARAGSKAKKRSPVQEQEGCWPAGDWMISHGTADTAAATPTTTIDACARHRLHRGRGGKERRNHPTTSVKSRRCPCDRTCAALLPAAGLPLGEMRSPVPTPSMIHRAPDV